MTDSQPINPNYTESEVWDLLTEYLVRNHIATASSVQRGIYADFNKDGSVFQVADSKDEFAILYCYRNLNFNISGSIIYQLDDEFSEEFTLKSICEFLGEPFPKEVSLIELNEDDLEKKKENLELAREYRRTQAQHKAHKERVRYATIAMFYAFEYHRATGCNNRAFHLSQLTKTTSQAHFIRSNRLQNNDEVLVIHPAEPSLDEFLNYASEQTQTCAYMGIPHGEVMQSAAQLFHQQYQNFFSAQARRVGSLIYPLRDLNGALISAINIIDIKRTENHDDFMILKNEANTIGSIQFRPKEPDERLAFITTSIEDADTLHSLMPQFTVHAALSNKNLAELTIQLPQHQPDTLFIAVLHDDYTPIHRAKNFLDFNKSGIYQLANALASSDSEPKNLGIILPRPVTTSEDHEYLTLNKLYRSEPIEVCQSLLQQEIDALILRYEAGESELLHLVDFHKAQCETLKEQYKLDIPKLITKKSEPESTTIPHPMIFAAKPNSVLFHENRESFMAWFNGPTTAKFLEEIKLWDEQVIRFALAAADMPKDQDQD